MDIRARTVSEKETLVMSDPNVAYFNRPHSKLLRSSHNYSGRNCIRDSRRLHEVIQSILGSTLG
jgi:hypothetical protein